MKRLNTKFSERNKLILEMYEAGKTTYEIAEAFEISHQRVSQILVSLGINNMKTRKGDKIKASEKLGLMPDTEIAKELNVCVDLVGIVRRRLGVKRYGLPIGCEDCKKYPYSRGACRKCYARAQRQGVLQSLLPKKKPGPKPMDLQN